MELVVAIFYEGRLPGTIVAKDSILNVATILDLPTHLQLSRKELLKLMKAL